MKKKALKQLLQQLQEQLLLREQVDTSPTIAEWSPVYQNIIRNRVYVVQTLRNKKANLKHVVRLWGDKRIGSLRPHEITTALRQFSPNRSSSAIRVLSELRDFYTEAIANGVVDSSPAGQVKPPQHNIMRERLPLELWLHLLEIAKVHSQKWVYPLMLLSVLTTQRRGDLVKMRFDDVHDGCLYIEQQKKARKRVGARVAIPLSLRLNVIGMTVGDVVEICRTAGLPGDTLLRKANGGKLEISSLSARFHECMISAAGPEAYSPYTWPSLHEARSLGARLYEEQGVHVQTLLGHKHASMTQVYIDDRGLSAYEWKVVKTGPPLKSDEEVLASVREREDSKGVISPRKVIRIAHTHHPRPRRQINLSNLTRP